ncbi:hypothetical protein BDFB_012234 [Asbolus verrucosus]|uniref:Uncharacterized protein n=1 Tax=Asbolus verrucosus TaxID=1661398 RepID=A0A482WA53_ASBVE|nr:hypothetical protein BDFB_012234 [Asbolus verrucosus]
MGFWESNKEDRIITLRSRGRGT